MAQSELPEAKSKAIDVAVSLFGGVGLLALVNAVAIAVAIPLPSAGLSLRLAHLAFDAAETLGLGVLVAGVSGAFVRFVRVPIWAVRSIVFGVWLAILYAVIGEYLALQATHALHGRFPRLLLVNAFVLLAGAFTAAPEVASHVAHRRGMRFVPVAVAVALLVANQAVLRDDYAGIHGLVGLGAALLAGPVLAPFVRRAGRSRPVLVAITLFALFGLAVPPSNAVRCELFRSPCTVAPWALATIVWRAPPLHSPVQVPASPWLRDRSSDPPVSPTDPPPLPPDAVVVFVTIDALRADVVSEAANDKLLPTFAALKRDGVVFTHASAPGTQTPLSIGTMFSGLYFSQQKWEDYGEGGDRYPYPASDDFPRVPELLTAHGVATVQESAYVFLAGSFGVTRGFREENVLGHTTSAAPAASLVKPMLERLAHPGDGPLFLYAHFAEPHAPYHPRKGASEYDGYLSRVAVADGQLGRVLRVLEASFGKRWVLIVSADHGEAFGDHQTFEHAKTLYEELLHVPLIVRSPLFAPRHVVDRVGLVDLGPTLLDLFRVDTPATFNGQSLVPFLTGQSIVLTRPLLAEGRLRTAITTPDGLKVIEDPRRKVVEAYDLTVDPKEIRNVFDVEPARVDPALAELRAFFATRTRRDGGYEPPYKP